MSLVKFSQDLLDAGEVEQETWFTHWVSPTFDALDAIPAFRNAAPPNQPDAA